MRKTTWLLRVVGGIQIILGLFYLFAPQFILHAMGHSAAPADLNYPLAMLASRFLAYGAALITIAADPVQHRLWMVVMVPIQIIDLAAGLFYTATGVVPLALSGLPMFNAAWIILLLLVWMPKQQRQTA